MHEISTAEKEYVVHSAASDLRADGRRRGEHRSVHLTLGTVPQANGSASLHLGNTHVVATVKAEINLPSPSAREEGCIHAHVECCPSASSSYLGKGGEEISIELSQSLERLLRASPINFHDLCIIPGLQVWHLHVDVLVIDDDGSLLDAASIAARAALRNTTVPQLQVIQGEDNKAAQIELVDDPRDSMILDFDAVPIFVTLSKMRGHYVVDATREEEACAECKVSVGVTPQQNIVSTFKSGQGGIHPSTLFDMLQVAQRTAAQVCKLSDSNSTSSDNIDVTLYAKN